MDRLGLSRTEIPWTQPRSEPVWEYEPFQRPDGPPGRLVREVRFSNPSWWSSLDACFSRASAATYALSRDLSQSPAPSIGMRIYMSSARPTPVGRASTNVLFLGIWPCPGYALRYSQLSKVATSRRFGSCRQQRIRVSCTASCARCMSRRIRVAVAWRRSISSAAQLGERLAIAASGPLDQVRAHHRSTAAICWANGITSCFGSPASFVSTAIAIPSLGMTLITDE